MGNGIGPCGSQGDVHGAITCLPGPLPCDATGSCRCSRGGPSSHLLDDDIVLLEMLEAAEQGELLLTKLHVNVALFASTAADIVEGIFGLLEHRRPCFVPQRHERQLQEAFREGLDRRAQPPVLLMKALHWIYRSDEMPSPAAKPAQRCVLQFFSTMLTAAAALKWQGCPPPLWQREGVEPHEVLKRAEGKLSEVVAGLRFLACLALLQQAAEPTLLGSRQLVRTLTSLTGVEPTSMKGSSETADERWELFFMEAKENPSKAAAKLLREIPHSFGSIEASNGILRRSHGRVVASPKGAPLTGPCLLSGQVIPLGCRDHWEDELVDVPALDSTFATPWDTKCARRTHIPTPMTRL